MISLINLRLFTGLVRVMLALKCVSFFFFNHCDLEMGLSKYSSIFELANSYLFILSEKITTIYVLSSYSTDAHV